MRALIFLALAACAPTLKLSPACRADYDRCHDQCAAMRRTPPTATPTGGTLDSHRYNQQNMPANDDCATRCDKNAERCTGASSTPAS